MTAGLFLEAGGSAGCLTFRAGDSRYAITVTAVRELASWSSPARLPNQPAYRRGLINLRGSLVPVFDLRAWLTGKATEMTSQHVYMIVAAAGRAFAVLVDAMPELAGMEDGKSAVIRITSEQLLAMMDK